MISRKTQELKDRVQQLESANEDLKKQNAELQAELDEFHESNGYTADGDDNQEKANVKSQDGEKKS